MDIFRDYSPVPLRFRGGVWALGNFDGLHPGHLAVIDAARGRGRPFGVIVFEPPPRAYFAPTSAPARLTPFGMKMRLLADAGVEVAACLRFNAALAQMSAEDFARLVLAGGLDAAHISVGANFRFGRGRKGAAGDLAAFGRAFGFGVAIVETKHDAGGVAYSSTAVREALARGDIAAAGAALGRRFAVEGRVRRGDARGRGLGFPTANLPLGASAPLAVGVYAARARIRGDETTHGAVVNVGRRPTFGGEGLVLEAHLFDFERDIYGARLTLVPVAFLRAERRFDGVEALKAQIEKDCVVARDKLGGGLGGQVPPI